MSNDKQKPLQIGIRVSAEMREKLETLAARDKRTLAAYIKLVLDRHIEEATDARADAKENR